jgi:hypothetical protein
MDNPQGSPTPTESNASQGSNGAESNVVMPNEIPKQYVVETPTTAPAVPQEQGLPQGTTQQQTTAETPDLARHYQSIADQRQAEVYRLQQELQRVQTQTQAQQANSERNPYDPTTQYEQWDEYRINKLLDKGISTYTKQLMDFAAQNQRQQQEQQWQSSHPSVDINLVKQWGQMNGVNNLDHAYTLMTLPNTFQAVQNQANKTAFNQFTQPQTQNVSTPTRGGQQAGGTIQLSYDAMAAEFANSKGRVYEQWSPELRRAFDTETYRRSDGHRG